MIRAFEYLTNLAVRCPLPNPLPRGEENRLLKIRERRIRNQMTGKLENARTRQPDSLSHGRGDQVAENQRAQDWESDGR